MTIGEKMEAHRRKMIPSVSQEKLAEKMGISTQSYQNKIIGRSSFKMKEVETAATALQVPIEELREDGPVVVNNSFHHQKGNGIVAHQGLAEQERALFERLLREKDEQIQLLRNLLKNAEPA